MCLFKKYWHKLSRLFNRQLGYFLDDKLLPAVERLFVFAKLREVYSKKLQASYRRVY